MKAPVSRSCERIKQKRQTHTARYRRIQISAPSSPLALLLLVATTLLCLSDAFVLNPSHPIYSTLSPSCKQPAPSTSTKLFGIKGFRGWFESQFPAAITAVPKKGSQENFDHVLIDINQLLHVAVRRSSSDDHALAILMRELNACVELATPTKSLVLAMDGSPSSAKLATSRKRRLSTLVKSEWKQVQLERFRKSKRLSLSKQKEARLQKRYAAEVETLRITPGTHFMERANQSLVYWAWQRMISQDGPFSKVSIYISTSESPGEGEVKLLDWILRKRPQGTLAIMGGDSDLVLEGLVIPPSICTHNVFILLPDVGNRYLVVSLWETTRHLSQLLPQLKSEDIMRVRTDMVLLLILNGNDYFPKLRGSSGFNRVFKAYIQIVQEWLQEGRDRPFLVDPGSLVFNREFAIAFFGRLKLDRPPEKAASIAAQQCNAIKSLGQLNNLVSTQFMPKPLRWKIICDSSDPLIEKKLKNSVDSFETSSNDATADLVDDDDDEDLDFVEDGDKRDFDVDDDDDEMLAFDGDKNRHVTLRLTLGKKGANDFYSYEIEHDPDTKIKDTKNELAKIALDDLMGEEYFESANETSASMMSVSYPWEISFAVDGDCELYLGGLLWNLQTYQDGICADYGYNYGKRLSPTADEMVEYFQKALDEDRQVGKKELLKSEFSPPVKNGISCLAALPSQLSELIIEPYCGIPSELVEQFYGQCVSPIDNAFDMIGFSKLCEAEMAKEKRRKRERQPNDNLKRVSLGEDFWTVVFRTPKPLEKPFAPPPPVIKKFSRLFVNRRIKAARYAAATSPRERSVWMDEGEVASSPAEDIDLCGISDLLASSAGDGRSVFDVDYWVPYPERWKKKKAGSKKLPSTDDENLQKNSRKVNEENSSSVVDKPKRSGKKAKRISVKELEVRMADFDMEIDSSVHPDVGFDGHTPLSHLLQLEQAEMIDFEWKFINPSPTDFASISPNDFECVTLIVRRGNASLNATFEGELVFQRDREITRGSKQQAKQYLASMALTRLLVGKNKNWFDIRFHDLKNSLISDYDIVSSPRLSEDALAARMKKFGLEPIEEIERSISGQPALTYLGQLHQDQFLVMELSTVCPSNTDFAAVSPEDFECIRLVVRRGKKKLRNPIRGELVFERDRLNGRDLKQVKQYLATAALSKLIDHQDKSWNQLSYKELKACMKASAKVKKKSLPEK